MFTIGICWEDCWAERSWVAGCWCPHVITPLYPIDKTWCFSRKGQREAISCLQRSDESLLALRRPPECPDELACPVGGCT